VRLQLITPPAIEPVTLAEAKQHLRVEISDDDSLINTLVSSARVHCESALKQALITQSWLLYVDSFPSAGGYYNRAIRETWPSLGGMPSGLGFYPGMVPNSTGVIDIPRPPVQSIDSVNYYDFTNTLQTMDPLAYTASLGTPSRIQPAYSKVWPLTRPTIDSVQIAFTSGYGLLEANVPAPIRQAMLLLIGAWYENREAVSAGSGVTIVPMAVDALLASCEHGVYA